MIALALLPAVVYCIDRLCVVWADEHRRAGVPARRQAVVERRRA